MRFLIWFFLRKMSVMKLMHFLSVLITLVTN